MDSCHFYETRNLQREMHNTQFIWSCFGFEDKRGAREPPAGNREARSASGLGLALRSSSGQSLQDSFLSGNIHILNNNG